MTGDAIGVVLVEDDADLREALTEYLELNGCAVTAVATGMGFYQALATAVAGFQVAVIDLGLPDQPGHVLAEYARRNTRLSVIVVTANDSLDNRIETYRTGADLHMAKPLDSRELLAAVVAMHRRYRERFVNASDPPAVATTVWALDRGRRRLSPPGGQGIALSPQETATLELFSAAGTSTVERARLMESLYGRQDESAQRALDNLIRRLRQKIANGNGGQPAPILTAYGNGYSFSEPLEQS